MQQKTTSIRPVLESKILQNRIALRLLDIKKEEIRTRHKLVQSSYQICKQKIIYINQMNELLESSLDEYSQETDNNINNIVGKINELDKGENVKKLLADLEAFQVKYNNLNKRFTALAKRIPNNAPVINETRTVDIKAGGGCGF